MVDKADDIKKLAMSAMDVERNVAEAEALLMTDERFKSFIELQRRAKDEIAKTWEQVQQAMEQHGIKSIKGDFGSITIAERTTFETNEDLPDNYYKLVPDTKMIGTYYSLTGEAPAGATPKVTRYLTKRLKG